MTHLKHEILRPMGDPRIHAAIVCASERCWHQPGSEFGDQQAHTQQGNQCLSRGLNGLVHHRAGAGQATRHAASCAARLSAGVAQARCDAVDGEVDRAVDLTGVLGIEIAAVALAVEKFDLQVGKDIEIG